MIFGDNDFGIETDVVSSNLGHIRLWVAGRPLGEFSDFVVLSSYQLDILTFFKCPRVNESHGDASALRRWYTGFLKREASSAEETSEMASLTYSIQLFPNCPAPFRDVRTVVLCEEEHCSITGWDVHNFDTSHVISTWTDVRSVLTKFVETDFRSN